MVKKGRHEALADIYESIDELKHYRETFLKLAEGVATQSDSSNGSNDS